MAGPQISKTTEQLCVALLGFWAVVFVSAADLFGQSIATYDLTVTNSWSQASHEDWAPLFSSVRRPHFSHLGGGTHDSSLSIWQNGGLSSPGMIYMQETGWIDHPDPATVDLKLEFDQHLADGSAYSFLNYPRHFSPLEPPVTVSLDVSSTHPLVTLVSMLGPSPDWFIGVSGLNMREAGDWREEITVDLFTHDGGTRSNDETFLCCQNGPYESPQKTISLFTNTPNVDDPSRTALTGAQIGTFTFQLQSVQLGEAILQAGDADMDFDFDQFDLVQVQIAGKYLSEQAATWGEGDWDGAPGGSPDDPPLGDGEFNQLDIVAALDAGTYLKGSYAAVAADGKTGDAQTSVTYDPATGEVAIDAPANIQLTSINIDSASGVFTGADAQNLGGSFDNDADDNIFKATFGGSFGSVSLGNVAQTGLTETFLLGDLTVVGSLSGGGDLGEVDLVYVPEPSTIAFALLAMIACSCARSIRA